MLRPLVDAAYELTPLGLVLADAKFDSEQNHRHVRERLAAASVIPASGVRRVGGCKAPGPQCEPPSLVSCIEGGRW
jgi:hypothetical protein